jgi:hypothetical protein
MASYLPIIDQNDGNITISKHVFFPEIHTFGAETQTQSEKSVFLLMFSFNQTVTLPNW